MLRASFLVAALLSLATVPNAQPPRPVMASTAATAPTDLPLVPLPPRTPLHAAATADSTLVVLLTGDGDWAEIDTGIADTLRAAGMAVVGLKSRSYLQGHDRTPDGMARDVERVVRYYGPLWQRPRVVLLGYSRGADLAPFVATRLASDVRSRVGLVAMLGLAQAANFHFYWSDIVSDHRRPTDLPVAPELARLRGTPMLCVYGADETDSGCRDADPTLVQRVERAGGHHFDKDYAALGALVARAATAR